MWVFDGKAAEYDGRRTKPNAKLVRRYEQRVDIDFGELSAPNFAVSSVSLLTAIECGMDVDLIHFDIEQTYVRSDLEGKVFMRLPQGNGRLSGKIVTLDKSLYSLKWASTQWHGRLTRGLTTLGFLHCLGDSCVLRLMEKQSTVMTIVVHVKELFVVEEKER